MTKTKFKEKLEQLKMSQKSFADFAGCSYQTVKQWREDNVPNWVPIVVEYLEVLHSAKKIICAKREI